MRGSASRLPMKAAGLHLRAAVSEGRASSLPFSGLSLPCAAAQYQPSKTTALVLVYVYSSGLTPSLALFFAIAMMEQFRYVLFCHAES